MLDQKHFRQREEEGLAPYAMVSRLSRGRKHEEKEHAFRTAYSRDRDRIIHATAFRRLEYKTQVFVNHEGDHYRTRLTHTLEAAQIARTIARFLRLNEDLSEAITLAHDLGHTPFGHAGEEAMNDLMQDHGGFEHNLQSLRIVDVLENRYPGFRGLNLSYEVREGIFKHSPRVKGSPTHPDFGTSEPGLEAQIVDLADEVAYINHDLEDGLSSGILTVDALDDVALWSHHFDRARAEFPRERRRILIRVAIRSIINSLTTDLIRETQLRIEQKKIASVEDAQATRPRLVGFTDSTEKQKLQLKAFLFQNMYRNYRVVRMAEKAKRVIRELFEAYTSTPQQLPTHIAARISPDGESGERVICDYIAGMTDRFALKEHRKLFDPLESV